MRRIDRKDKAAQLEMWNQLEELQETFPFTIAGLMLFAQTVLNQTIVGKPDLNRVQADILKFLLSGGKYIMIQAQRGQAKTTLSAIFCVFMLIHQPHHRILVFSQNGKRSKEIAGWVIKIFYALDFLDFMRPDQYGGDRASVESFDVHWVFRGDDKSPSVSCYSIESGAQGARADLILADDIESLQNSRTIGGREWLMEQALEFESINQTGRIIYLGTPQSVESIYNQLPSRGYKIRIWTGRYPNLGQMEYYAGKLAPMLFKDIKNDPSIQTGGGLDGSLGKPTCPEMYPEHILSEKELAQGKAKFMLQFMLNTGLNDAERYPLKIENLIVANFSKDSGPVMPIWNTDSRSLWEHAPRFGTRKTDKFYRAMHIEYQYRKFERTVMYIDPSGGGRNGDEMAFAIVKLLGSYLYIYKVGGVKGGYDESELLKLVSYAKEGDVDNVYVEKNFGHGAHFAALKPLFEKHYNECSIEEVYESGQKELRMIDTIEPVLNQHRLVVRQECISEDYDTIQQYSADIKMSYSLFYQLAYVTRDKGCLRHDDRLDALHGAIAQLVNSIDYDQSNAEQQRIEEEAKRYNELMSDPETYVKLMQNGNDMTGIMVKNQSANAFSRYR